MTTFLGIVIIAACVLLILVVMVQNSKGGGLDSSFGAVNQIGNVAQSTETIEKATWYLAGVIAFICLISVFIGQPSKSGGEVKSTGFDGNTTQLPQ